MKYKISELASLLNVSTNTIRRYENKGYIHSEHESKNNYRIFGDVDAIKFMNVRLLRKYGFSHEEIDLITQSDWNNTTTIFQTKVDELDSLIEHYTFLRNRLNMNIQLLDKMRHNSDTGYFRDCVSFSYILYQKGNILLDECERKKSIQTFIDEAPYLFKIYMLKKEDLCLKNPPFYSAWAIKTKDFESLHLSNTQYIETYKSQASFLNFLKVPLSPDLQEPSYVSQIVLGHLTPSICQLNDMGLVVNDDIIGLEISVLPEKGVQTQQILVNIPIAPKSKSED